MHQFNSKKWDRFRELRKQYIDLYIRLRKKQSMVEMLAKVLLMRKCIGHVAKCYDYKWNERERILKGRYLNLKISQVWRRRLKRWAIINRA